MEEVGRADLGELGRLVLYGSREDAHPGQIVTGMVNLRIDVVPLLIKGIWVKLSGKSSVNAAHADLGTHFLSLDDTHSNAGESSGTFIDFRIASNFSVISGSFRGFGVARGLWRP